LLAVFLRIVTLLSVVMWRRVARTTMPEDLRYPAACVQIRVDLPGVRFVCFNWEDARGMRRCPGAIVSQQLVGMRHD
jgi:hypothetical protein